MIIVRFSKTAISGYSCFGLSFGPIATMSQIRNCKGLRYSDAIEAFLLPSSPAKAMPNNFPHM